MARFVEIDLICPECGHRGKVIPGDLLKLNPNLFCLNCHTLLPSSIKASWVQNNLTNKTVSAPEVV